MYCNLLTHFHLKEDVPPKEHIVNATELTHKTTEIIFCLDRRDLILWLTAGRAVQR